MGLLEVRCDDKLVRFVVAKFFHRSPRDSLTRIRAALNSAPPGFRHHLAGTELDPIDDSGSCVMFEAAGGDVANVRPLSEVLAVRSLVDQTAALETIVGAVVEDWNPADSPESGSTTVGELLVEILGERIAPNGAIRAWLKQQGVPFDGSAVPNIAGLRLAANPFALLNHPDIADLPLHSVLRGWAHGDLSGRNIVLPTDPLGPEDFVLIDIDRCRGAQPLARDPMHLLLPWRFTGSARPANHRVSLPTSARALLAAVTPDRRPVATDFGRVARA